MGVHHSVYPVSFILSSFFSVSVILLKVLCYLGFQHFSKVIEQYVDVLMFFSQRNLENRNRFFENRSSFVKPSLH